MSVPASVLVVGASAAGLSTVEALRRKGYQGRLTVLGAEWHLPYDRPPLSKQVLSGSWEPQRAQLRPETVLSDLDIEFVLGDPAVSLDGAVHTASGRSLSADVIVAATGLTPRVLPGQNGMAGVHVLRTLDDALSLRADLLSAKQVVVVGDGVLGAEVAATARGMGLAVTMTGPQQAPLAAQFGPLVANLLADLHTAHGVELKLGQPVTGLAGRNGRVIGVCTADGEVLPADVVVVALGAAPATEWLTGLMIDNGVVCDARCRAADGIYAVGDIARWHHPGVGSLVRLENRTNATEQAIAVAAGILGDSRPYAPVPYFWTDQFDVRIHVHGLLPAAAEVTIVEGDPAAGRFVASYRQDGTAVGVLGWNMPRQARQHRQRLLVNEVLVGGTSR